MRYGRCIFCTLFGASLPCFSRGHGSLLPCYMGSRRDATGSFPTVIYLHFVFFPVILIDHLLPISLDCLKNNMYCQRHQATE